MKEDYPNNLNKEDLLNAFNAQILSDLDWKILKFQYQMDKYSISATQLAIFLKYKKYTAANLVYANISKKIAKFTNKYPYQSESSKRYYWFSLLSTTKKVDGFDLWIMRDVVIEAIEELQLFSSSDNLFPEEIHSQSKILLEGASKKIIVNAYERNPKARKECIEHYGVKCKVCDFDFEKEYGELGKDFIHVHHIKPLNLIKEEYKVNPIEDLIPLCPNCHAMIHRYNTNMTITELKNIKIKN